MKYLLFHYDECTAFECQNDLFRYFTETDIPFNIVYHALLTSRANAVLDCFKSNPNIALYADAYHLLAHPYSLLDDTMRFIELGTLQSEFETWVAQNQRRQIYG